MAHGHDPTIPQNFKVRVDRRDGPRLHAVVELAQTIPAGGLEVRVIYDAAARELVEVHPYRKLGIFVLEALHDAAGH